MVCCADMGLLDEAGLERRVAAGCEACGSKRLTFRAFVDGMLPIMGGEPIGSVSWVYDGEKFVDGVFEIACGDCKRVLFAETVCPRCHSPGGLARALERPNRWPVPPACSECQGEELRYVALLPVRVAYQGNRADKARSVTELHDNGFHGYRVSCRACGTVAERSECPLCGAPAPLRIRPG
jgi:RNA polymerase subunit RPABC4/transcription elongation factor Spt4